MAIKFKNGELEQQQAETLAKITQESVMFAVAVMRLYQSGQTDYRPQTLYNSLAAAAGGPISSACLSAESTTSTASGGEKFVHNCGKCGYEINRDIRKGYKCPRCEGVYEGC